MGFLGTRANSFSDMVLIAQIAGLMILILGFMYARKKKFLKHDTMAKIAILTGSLSFAWMGYSLISSFLALVSINFLGLLIVSHVIIGISALFMGLSLVLDEIKKTKIAMKITFISWIGAIFLGVMLYIIYIA